MLVHHKGIRILSLLVIILILVICFSVGIQCRSYEPYKTQDAVWWSDYFNRNIFLMEIQGISEVDSAFYQLLRNNGREILNIFVVKAIQYPDFSSKSEAENLQNIFVPKDMVDDLLNGKTILLMDLSYHEWSGFNTKERTRVYGILTEDEVFRIQNGALQQLNANSNFHTAMLDIMNAKVKKIKGDDSLILQDGFDIERLDEYFDSLRSLYYQTFYKNNAFN